MDIFQRIKDRLVKKNEKKEENEVIEEKTISIEDTSYIVEDKETLLSPMLELLDKKNINRGVSFTSQNGKLYCCFEQGFLSEVNQFILFKIANVYSNTLFFSDNDQVPILDRLEYWNPDGYDKSKIMQCRNKKVVAIELPNDDLTILGTTLMLANCLQEQDPFQLKVNEQITMYTEDDVNRHDHYNIAGCPDKKWISLNIALNMDNPLRENPYAPFFTLTEINSKENAGSVIEQIFTGVEEKKFISFNMESDHLKEVVKDYLKTISCNADFDDLDDMSGVKALLGGMNKQLRKEMKKELLNK